MTRPLPWGGRFAALLLLSVGLLPLLIAGPRTLEHVRSPKIQDWSTRHTLYSQTGTSAALEAAQSDPRAIFRWREAEQRAFDERSLRSFREFPIRRPPRTFPSRTPVAPAMQRDWAISLGTAGTAAAMYPAKYTFDVTATPSCANDFVVFPVNAAGSASQANLVAFNNLYSGTAGSTGICDGRGTPGGDTDTKTSATVMWAYNVQSTINGGVPGSPALSFDGTKVAFIESAAGKQAHFHVLAWKSGNGVGTNLQSTATPQTISTFSATAPAAGSGTATDLALDTALATGSDTLSSPYIDYANDYAYVGNDSGYVFRIKNVFCTTTGCGTSVPSVDTTWGTLGAVKLSATCTGQVTGPVLDFFNLNVYVGCSDGKLYAISQSGTVASLTVGDGVSSKAFGGIVDPPIVDGVNGFIYAVSGSANNGANGVLVQAKADFSSSVAVPIGNGNQCNIHAPALSNAYFTSPTATGSLIYIGGVTGTIGTCTAGGATGGTSVLYGATFGAGGVLNSGAPANSLNSGNPVGSEYAPMGEFFNATTGTDLLFVSLLRNNSREFVNLYSFPITTGWNTTIQSAVTEGLGISGMVVDNDSASGQASSIYFNSLDQNAACASPQSGANTIGCAVKLTQAGFQ
jgi:hypothetical protein